nr:uncharacterized protein CI109_005965 [Kwoniella shandongensis]KAA5525657.1 hypothetical protein CI109_005965 [Kwoniella shandongensis]
MSIASPIAPPISTTPTPTPEEIRKVVADYKSRQKKDTKDPKDEKDTDKDNEKEETKSPSTPPIPVVATPPAPAAPTHKKYTLHRAIFEMRKNELKKKEMGVKAREVGKGLPQVPRTAF